MTQCKIFNKNHKRGRQTGLANDPWTVRPVAERAEDWFVRLALVLLRFLSGFNDKFLTIHSNILYDPTFLFR
jgi:hypothetical protein